MEVSWIFHMCLAFLTLERISLWPTESGFVSSPSFQNLSQTPK